MSEIIQFQRGAKKDVADETVVLTDEQIDALGLTDTLNKNYREIGRPLMDVLNVNGLFAGLRIRITSSVEGVRETYYIATECDDPTKPVDDSKICLQVYHLMGGTKFQDDWPSSYTKSQLERWDNVIKYTKQNGAAHHPCSLAVHAIGSITTGISSLSGLLNTDTLPKKPLPPLTGHSFSVIDSGVFLDFYYFEEYVLMIKTLMKNMSQEYIEGLNPTNAKRVGFIEPKES